MARNPTCTAVLVDGKFEYACDRGPHPDSEAHEAGVQFIGRAGADRRPRYGILHWSPEPDVADATRHAERAARLDALDPSVIDRTPAADMTDEQYRAWMEAGHPARMPRRARPDAHQHVEPCQRCAGYRQRIEDTEAARPDALREAAQAVVAAWEASDNADGLSDFAIAEERLYDLIPALRAALASTEPRGEVGGVVARPSDGPGNATPSVDDHARGKTTTW